MDNGAESTNKLVSGIRLTGKLTNSKVSIHAASPGDEIDKVDIEDGTDYRARVSFADSNIPTRYERKKVKVKNLSIWTARFSGRWDGIGERDRLDELIIEGSSHGVTK